jgi:hypothetical protein
LTVARMLGFIKTIFIPSAPRKRTIQRGALLILACAAFQALSGCLPLPEMTETPVPIPSDTPAPTASPTETIVWFPPTVTYTPFATREVQPTPDMRPALGETVLVDDFSERDVWPVSRSSAGSAAYGRGELTLAISSPRGMVMSLRPQPAFSDFYLEVDVFPSLCRAADVYGLMLRAESNENYYRLLVNCSGQMRMERVQNSRAVPLQDWTTGGQGVFGALVKVRLGVWGLKDELRVFANDVYQFSVRDPVMRSGKIGVLARAAGDSPVTVNFSNLTVRQVDAERMPTLTPTPTATARP